MVAEVVLSVMGNRSDRRFPNLSCRWALEAAELTRRRRADFHQGPERKIKLLKEAEYMAATGFTFHPTIAFRSGLGPYKAQDIESAAPRRNQNAANHGMTAAQAINPSARRRPPILFRSRRPSDSGADRTLPCRAETNLPVRLRTPWETAAALPSRYRP